MQHACTHSALESLVEQSPLGGGRKRARRNHTTQSRGVLKLLVFAYCDNSIREKDAWNACDVSPLERSHQSDSRAAASVLSAHARTLIWEVS